MATREIRIGVAPSRDLMRQITVREQDLLDRGGMVLPPDPAGAVPADPAIAGEALRTVPPRENAGNVDIRQCGMAPRAFYATTGLSIDAGGVNHSEDVTIATRDALREMIDHLTTERGNDRQQAYAICSVAVDLRVAALPDVPNMVVTALLPTEIFEDERGAGSA